MKSIFLGAAVLSASVFALSSSGNADDGFATYTASVFASGTIAHSNGVSSVVRLSNHYQVTFTRPVNTCVYVTSLFGAGPGFVKAAPNADNPATLNVATYAANGTTSSLPFSIIVACGP